MATAVTRLLVSLSISISNQGVIMQHDEQPKADYEAPEIIELGDATELTTGNTANQSDYLGDPRTEYHG